MVDSSFAEAFLCDLSGTIAASSEIGILRFLWKLLCTGEFSNALTFSECSFVGILCVVGIATSFEMATSFVPQLSKQWILIQNMLNLTFTSLFAIRTLQLQKEESAKNRGKNKLHTAHPDLSQVPLLT